MNFVQKREKLTLEAYTDANYVGSIDDKRSTSHYYTFLGGNPITWRNKKQIVVATSSVEAQFKATALGICELLWHKNNFRRSKIAWEGPMKPYYDNKSTINIAQNPVQHDQTKYI